MFAYKLSHLYQLISLTSPQDDITTASSSWLSCLMTHPDRVWNVRFSSLRYTTFNIRFEEFPIFSFILYWQNSTVITMFQSRCKTVDKGNSRCAVQEKFLKDKGKDLKDSFIFVLDGVQWQCFPLSRMSWCYYTTI